MYIQEKVYSTSKVEWVEVDKPFCMMLQLISTSIDLLHSLISWNFEFIKPVLRKGSDFLEHTTRISSRIFFFSNLEFIKSFLKIPETVYFHKRSINFEKLNSKLLSKFLRTGSKSIQLKWICNKKGLFKVRAKLLKIQVLFSKSDKL